MRAFVEVMAIGQSLFLDPGSDPAALKEVLDRVELPLPEAVPGAEEEEPSDRWRLPRTDIVITRMEQGPHKDEYLFSAETVVKAGEFYERVRSAPYRSDGPKTSLHTQSVIAS